MRRIIVESFYNSFWFEDVIKLKLEDQCQLVLSQGDILWKNLMKSLENVQYLMMSSKDHEQQVSVS